MTGRVARLEPEFVEFIPSTLLPGKLYISMIYATTQHLCACGCRKKVVLPLSPAEWHLRYNGESVSMSPSVGNWEYTCQSHYWIEENRIRWAAAWSPKQIETGRRRDLADLESYFDERRAVGGTAAQKNRTSEGSRILRWFRKFVR